MKLARLLVLLLIVLGSAAVFAQSSPLIVAQVSLFNQSSEIPSTPIFTPVTSGVYRISAHMEAANRSNGKWNLNLIWEEGLGYESTPKGWVSVPPDGGSNGPLFAQATEIVRAAAGYPISYSVGTPAQPRTSYNLFIIVEQLESDQ